MADLYLTPAERYTAALGGFYYGDLPEPGTVYTQLIKDISNGSTPDKVPKNILARFIYSLYISDLEDPYPRYELAKLLYWKLHDITPTKSGSVLAVTIDGKEDYMTINTDLSRLWYKVLFGSKTDVITEFPYIFSTMQNKLSDWGLFGNTETSGTPTLDSPVMPQGTGERTGNLFDYKIAYASYLQNDGTVQAYAQQLATVQNSLSNYLGQTITIRIYCDTVKATRLQIIATENGVQKSSNNIYRGESGYMTLTITPQQSIDKWSITYGSTGSNETLSQFMINTGLEALSYEPYGYKLDISSGGTTTPIYLGEVETTRKIKKLVLTGEEQVRIHQTLVSWFQIFLSDIVINNLESCTHYKPSPSSVAANIQNGEILVQKQTGSNEGRIVISDTSYTTADEFKTYLQQQYAAGTPVTVWYVLAEPTTGIVNEPLMKIGEYADSMSRTQTGIDIPTVIGQNTLDVLTTVKPSSMSIEYTSADENRSRSKRISLLKSPLKKGLIK